MDLLGVKIDVTRPMRGLSIADQQMVEIARALASDSRLIIMDEPTAPLTPKEVETLFAIARRLRDEGRTIIFISHRLEEVRALCDRVTIFRDGNKIATDAIGKLGDADIIRLMIGRPLKEYMHKTGASDRRGGAQGRGPDAAGQSSATSASRCARARSSGSAGSSAPAAPTWPARSSASRRQQAARDDQRQAGRPSPTRRRPSSSAWRSCPRTAPRPASSAPFRSSRTSPPPSQARSRRRGIIRARDREGARRRTRCKKLRIRLASLRQPIGELSGGNQQKAILARWLLTDPSVLILDEPTRGIDIGVKAEFYDMIGELAAQGRAILLISSELPELLALCDRVLVMSEGRLTADIPRAEATQENDHERGRAARSREAVAA